VLAASSVPALAAGPSPSPAVTPPAGTLGGPRNRALGLGEPRDPEPFTLEQRLLEAVRQNDRATIERAIERGATLAAKDDLQRSTVLLAVKDAGDLGLVRWLHEKGAALDEPDLGGRTPLSFAAALGHREIARYLVEHGAAVDRRDMNQRTALFQAALGNHPDVIALLAEHGADPNVRDKFQDTPLIVACAKGNAAAAARLLALGADPGLRDQEGRTARERSAPGTAPCLGPAPE